jgi:LacI family transcriptional regulator
MATIADIAKLAGVSDVTVSRILNGKADYRRPTFAKRAAKIHELAREMGYRPNASAMAVRSGRFGTVALLLSADRTWSMLPDQLLAGIRAGLTERDLHLLVEAMSDDVLTSEAVVPKLLRELTCDGLLINYNTNIPPEMLRLIDSYNLPSIWINSKQPHDCVYPDDYQAGATITRHLLSMGHRRIVFGDFNSPTDRVGHYSQTDRFAGYASIMRDAGLPPRRVGDRYALGAGRIVDVFMETLREDTRPTAFVCYGPEDASAAFMAARLLSLSVPQDLSLACFMERTHELLGMRFATMILPESAVGREAVRMLMTKIKHPEHRQACVAVPFELDPGKSLATAVGP